MSELDPDLDRTMSVAPMMGCTDRHCRVLLRLLSPHALLFTEMVVSGALIYGDTNHFLQHEDDEPCALQIAGSNPDELATCAQLGEAAGYQEINLNVGCPSDRVQHARIGACLMADPRLVQHCISAMKAKVDIPVTVKCRIGIDDDDSFENFRDFINIVAESGCDTFYIHARKAILDGLTARQNRDIPPLKYEYVYRIAREFPHCRFYLNGGIRSVAEALEQLGLTDGVMLGRAIYQNPYLLMELDSAIYGTALSTRHDILDQYAGYASKCLTRGEHAKHMLKHILGLYSGCPGARQFRRYLSTQMFKPKTTMDILNEALRISGLTSDHNFVS
ncbi:MAG TPA: tRNA dihydrouridine(20/20a) synthase DusA [Pseudomonadales bacterium]|nr:tRNA dihydrouridine(20/20a) synthase DusA [Pseudomonadales bacterium]MDP6315339.1 tRNA dihydrouridine(20/20a) synthase DusA [Pseudomonadales bacterium]MDP7315394.1 tRNA dihydrouridine(20/20a) synthase DusA [Pseudomonadales bacterium]HJP50148.1 tRNA dihydrouridine(20/20a) synthase DusA [Pseudomonadales bacterium]|tara:strand:+ start:3127 stop:4125 length:999 start_codon:yes stop_codon:yes gene_type:complete